jgi:adenylate cyclase
VVAIPDTTHTVARDSAGLPEPSAAEVRAALERMLASRCFEQASRSSKFLRFVVEQTLAGQGDRLKGYTIAIEVFGRPADFDAQSDPLVRVEAGRLRRRMTEYYSDEGRSDAVRIHLPRGSYSVTSSYYPPPAEVLLGPMPPNAPAAHVAADNRRRWRRIRSVLIAAIVLAGLGVVLLQQLELARLTDGSPSIGTSRARLPGKAPIVVRAFEDLGGDEPAVGALAGALREELLLLLDDPRLFVVATQAGDAAGPAAAAGAYVLSGTVRATAGAVRITTRLVAPDSGTQIWSSAYDEPLAPLAAPAAQRALARRIAAVAEPYGPIFESELARLRALPQADLTLADCVLKYYEFRRVLDRVRHGEALACFDAATAREPSSAEGWAGLALLSAEQYAHGYSDEDTALGTAREAARRALDIDGDNLHANLALAGAQFFGGEDFRPVAERMLARWPDNGEAQAMLGAFFVLAGDTARGRALVDNAIEATARAPSGYHATRALAALRDGNVDEALATALRIDSPDWPLGHLIVAAAAALAGRADLASRARARALELEPTIATSYVELLRRWRVEPVLAADLERGFDAAGRL